MLVGREAECAALEGALRTVQEGRSSVLMLRGQAGIGKTALLEHAWGAGDGMTRLRCEGVEAETNIPYAGLHQLLRPLAGRVDALPAPQAAALRAALGLSAARDAETFLVAAGMLGLLADAADTAPVVLFVDDAQWLDPESLTAIAFAARRLEAERVAVLLAVREPAPPLPVDALPALRIEPLAGEDAVSLLAQTAGDLDAGVRARVLEEAVGNPLALRELPAALSDDQRAGRRPVPAVLPVGAALERALLDRARRLPGPARDYLLLAAAEDAGDAPAVARAAAWLGLDASAAADAQASGVLVADGDRLHFFHPLARSAVIRGASPGARTRAHRALAETSRDEDRAIWHRAAAMDEPDEQIAAALDAAGERARDRGAHGSAAGAFARAAELTPRGPEATARLIAAAQAAQAAGRLTDAVALLDRAGGAGPEATALRGAIELERGSPERAEALLVEAAEAFAALDPGRARLLLLSACEAQAMGGRYDRAAEIGALAHTLAADSRDPAAELLEGFGAAFGGDVATAAERFGAVLARARDLNEPRLLGWCANGAAHLGDISGAVDLSGRAVAAARRGGHVERLPYALWLRAAYGTQRGLLADVEADASEGLQLARDTGQATVAVHLESTLAWVMGVRGDEARCRALVDSSAAVAAARGLSDVRAMADFALAELDLGLGRPEAALERLEAIAGEHGHPVWRGAATPVLAEAAAVAGQPERARPAVERFAAWAEQTGSTWAAPLVAGAQALLADGADTEAGLREALRLQAAEPSALADARTNLHLGAHLRRRRRRAEARAHLRRALETFERLGAAGWAERAAAELRASGETARRRDPTTRDELTPQERQIARLVAAGASNREAAQQLFLSPRTVEYHLRKVFQKLGIASRAELAGVELP